MVNNVSTSARIDSQRFIAVLWSGTAISLCFLAFRLIVRFKSFQKIYADDVLVLIAWLLFFTSAILWQWQQTAMYEQYILASGTVIPTPEQLSALKTFSHVQVVTINFYYISLWLVKLSFLVFFRRLGQKVRGQRVWWWCVTGFTVAIWATCISTFEFKCFLRSLDYQSSSKCEGRAAQKLQWINLAYICAVDVTTDVAIITIPIIMLWSVRISWKKKLALISIFSLTIIVIIFSIVRVALLNWNNSIADTSWLYMWNNIEIAVSLVVSCLASFRQLFVKSEQTGVVPGDDKVNLWRGTLLSAFTSSKERNSSSCGEGSFTRKNHHHGNASMPDSTEYIVPLDTIYISHDTDKSSNMDLS